MAPAPAPQLHCRRDTPLSSRTRKLRDTHEFLRRCVNVCNNQSTYRACPAATIPRVTFDLVAGRFRSSPGLVRFSSRLFAAASVPAYRSNPTYAKAGANVRSRGRRPSLYAAADGVIAAAQLGEVQSSDNRSRNDRSLMIRLVSRTELMR